MFAALSPRARLLLKISFLVTFAEAMLVPMYAAFTEKIGGSILDAGIAFAVFSMATGGAVALLGTRSWFQHHIKTFLMLGFVTSAACDISYIFVSNKWRSQRRWYRHDRLSTRRVIDEPPPTAES
jgi:hypothetical protein